jgi:hypothetical protein
MKRPSLALTSFLVSLFASLYIVFAFGHIFTTSKEGLEGSPPPAPLGKAQSISADPSIEFRDLGPDETIFPESDDLIDLFETDGLLRESEAVAKSGEEWTVLFEQNGTYSLKRSTAKVVRKRTTSYPGDENDVQLSFSSVGVPIFAIRNLRAVRRGPVTTLYHRPSEAEIDRRHLPIGSMQTGYKQDFNLNGSFYTLRVSRGLGQNGKTVGLLVLDHNGISQIIARTFYDSSSGEIIGRLLWVGDLDGDGKVDFYFDRDNEIGAFQVGLYLSSRAKPGELIRLAALFGTAGC